MMSIPSYLAAELGLNSCELPEDELEGRMLLAGITKGSDVFNSPLLDTVTKEPRVFTDFVLPLLDTVDMMILARVNKTMRRIVKVHTYTTVVTDTKQEIFRVPTFVKSVTLLRWARENGCPWDERTCATAAAGGQLEVLQWARENGCPWDEMTCAAAAAGQYLEVLQWALENSCPSGIDSLLLWKNTTLGKTQLWEKHNLHLLYGENYLGPPPPRQSVFVDKMRTFQPTATTAGRDYMEIFPWAFVNGFDQKELRRVSKLRSLGISGDKLKVFESRFKTFAELFKERHGYVIHTNDDKLDDFMKPTKPITMDELYSASASWLEAGRFTRTEVGSIMSHKEEFDPFHIEFVSEFEFQVGIFDRTTAHEEAQEYINKSQLRLAKNALRNALTRRFGY
jgi:hypothetical protein